MVGPMSDIFDSICAECKEDVIYDQGHSGQMRKIGDLWYCIECVGL